MASLKTPYTFLPYGKTMRIAKEAPTGAYTQSWYFVPEADAVLLSLYVASVSSSITVSIYTQTEDGKDVLRGSFPVISAPTANIVLKKAADIISQCRVEVVTDDAADFELYAKAVSGAESSVRVLGSDSARASQKDVAAAPTLLIPASLNDRAGLIFRNNNGLGGAIIYIGFTPSEVDAAVGYPLLAQESLAMDVSSGVSIYGQSSVGTSDLRIIEAGS